MITYANVELTPFDDQLQRECDAWWDAHAPDLFSFPGYLTAGVDHLPIPYPPMRRPSRLGVLVWPTGASRWGQFHHFASGDQVAAIRQQVGDSTPSARTLAISDDSGHSVSPQMWLLPPRPAFQSGSKELYLLTLVDQRYRWWLKGDQSAPTASTWTDLLIGLFAAVGLAPTIPAIPAAYKTPNSIRWWARVKPIPLLIDAALAAVGLRCLVGTDGTVSLATASSAIANEGSQWDTYAKEIVYGGRMTVADIGRSVPSTVAAIFSSAAGMTVATTVKSLSSLALSEYGSAVGMPASTAQVFSDLPVASTGSDRDNYAVQAATDYYRWSLGRVDATFRLVVPWESTGLEDRIEWEHVPDRVVTRVVRADFADRDVLGDYPLHVEIIRLTGGTRNADGDYPGFIQVFDEDTDTWSDGEAVWVRDAN